MKANRKNAFKSRCGHLLDIGSLIFSLVASFLLGLVTAAMIILFIG